MRAEALYNAAPCLVHVAHGDGRKWEVTDRRGDRVQTDDDRRGRPLLVDVRDEVDGEYVDQQEGQQKEGAEMCGKLKSLIDWIRIQKLPFKQRYFRLSNISQSVQRRVQQILTNVLADASTLVTIWNIIISCFAVTRIRLAQLLGAVRFGENPSRSHRVRIPHDSRSTLLHLSDWPDRSQPHD